MPDQVWPLNVLWLCSSTPASRGELRVFDQDTKLFTAAGGPGGSRDDGLEIGAVGFIYLAHSLWKKAPLSLAFSDSVAPSFCLVS